MHSEKILNDLKQITGEEQAILDGRPDINRSIYMTGGGDVFNSARLLASGKLITLRPHTRFIAFPEHSHDYVEVVYVCSGQSVHIVSGKRICMQAGELLFLGQNARHSIEKAGLEDISVNLIVLPEFFTRTLSEIGVEDTPLRCFLLDCLFKQNIGPGYLYFRVAENEAVQNLMENLLGTLLYQTANRRRISQLTMTLLFLELMAQTRTLEVSEEDSLIFSVLQYVEQHYADGSLTEAAEALHFDIATLSREIHRRTGKTYTRLVQDMRMTQAAFLLRTTDQRVDDIAREVGYENISYFHRLFQKTYGMPPRKYRVQEGAR